MLAYLTACLASGSSGCRLVEKIAAPTSRNATPSIPTTGYALCSTRSEEDPGAPAGTFRRQVVHSLNAEQDSPKNSQSNPVQFTELHPNSYDWLFDICK